MKGDVRGDTRTWMRKFDEVHMMARISGRLILILISAIESPHVGEVGAIPDRGLPRPTIAGFWRRWA